MQDLKITLLQTTIYTDDPDANRKHFREKLEQITGETDLIILPEMFTTGFPADPAKYAENFSGPTLQWMKEIAAEKNAVVTGSIIIEKEGQYFNSLIWMQPGGSYSTYNKRHIFYLGKESTSIAPGKEKLITELNNWKISPMICYDLRFPVWSKNIFNNGKYDYDLLVYVANWPAARSYPWKQLLIARAMENQSYVIGVNRIGKDKNSIPHSGDSMIIDPEGEVLLQAKAAEECLVQRTLSWQKLLDYRKKFNVAANWDKFHIEE